MSFDGDIEIENDNSIEIDGYNPIEIEDQEWSDEYTEDLKEIEQATVVVVDQDATCPPLEYEALEEANMDKLIRTKHAKGRRHRRGHPHFERANVPAPDATSFPEPLDVDELERQILKEIQLQYGLESSTDE